MVIIFVGKERRLPAVTGCAAIHRSRMIHHQHSRGGTGQRGRCCLFQLDFERDIVLVRDNLTVLICCGLAVLLTDFTPVIPVLLFVPVLFSVSAHVPFVPIMPYFTLLGSSASSASTLSGNSDSVITRTRTQVRRRLPTFFSDIKKSSFFCLYGAKKGGGNLHLATGCRAAQAPFRSVALRHRLSPAVPFSVQLLFCEPHRYLCLPIFYVHSIPDLPKNARRFSKNI